MPPSDTNEYAAAQKRLREAAELRKQLADEALAESEAEAEAAEAAEEEAEAEKRDNTRFMSADRKLTHLPLHWAFLTLLVCMGLSFLANQVDGERMRQALSYAQDKGHIAKDDKDLAERGVTTFEQRKVYQEKLREINAKRAKHKELAHKARHILEASEHADEEEESKLEQLAEMPLTVEDFREWMEQKAGPQWSTYRNSATAIALVIGGLGLVVAAFMVRIAGAVALGLVGGVFGFFLGLDPLIIGAVALGGAVMGMWLAPRMLLASIYSNALLAGLIVGGAGSAGAVYIGTGEQWWALAALGLGALFGAMIAWKFARQFYLCSVLANTAGMGMFILWLFWGEAFPYFTQVTFGGLMITDGILTRLYQVVRYH